MSAAWKYQAISRTGHEVTGVGRGNKSQVIDQLAGRGMFVVDLKKDHCALWKSVRPRPKFSAEELMRFFEDVHNMDAAGLNIIQIVRALQETAKDTRVGEVLEAMEEKIREGESLTQALMHTKVFPWIVAATIQAGEQTGKLPQSFKVLSVYFRRQSEIRHKLSQALVYPAIVFTVLTGVMLFVGLHVIPRLQTLLPQHSLADPSTRLVLFLSSMTQQYWFMVPALPIATASVLYYMHRRHKDLFKEWSYSWPVIGTVLKDSDLAHYFLNLSVLLKSGVPLLGAVQDLHALNTSPASRHFFNCREYMFSGMTFWETVKKDKFFPSMVAVTLRRGEELVRLDDYCLTLAEYFNKQVAARVDAFLQLVQPVLLLFGGLFLALVAFAFLVPIYGSLSRIAGGG